jgi:hypothetical protein
VIEQKGKELKIDLVFVLQERRGWVREEAESLWEMHHEVYNRSLTSWGKIGEKCLMVSRQYSSGRNHCKQSARNKLQNFPNEQQDWNNACLTTHKCFGYLGQLEGNDLTRQEQTWESCSRFSKWCQEREYNHAYISWSENEEKGGCEGS